MKKLLGIMVLGLLLSGNVYAENNLKGIKNFKLVVKHQGECSGSKYIKDVEIAMKYLLANSKIILVDKDESEYLDVSIFTISGPELCASTIELSSYIWGLGYNSAGNKGIVSIKSYSKTGLMYSGNSSEHKSILIDWVESKTKGFVVDWVEAQK